MIFLKLEDLFFLPKSQQNKQMCPVPVNEKSETKKSSEQRWANGSGRSRVTHASGSPSGLYNGYKRNLGPLARFQSHGFTQPSRPDTGDAAGSTTSVARPSLSRFSAPLLFCATRLAIEVSWENQ